MSLIDEDGNLFGVVNIIDALAVSLVLVALVAGIAFIGVLGADTESETRYATVDLGSQPDHVIDRLAVGDNATIGGNSLTVTDVYVTPPPDDDSDDSSHAIVRVAIDGERIEAGDRTAFEVAGTRLYVGSELEFETQEYSVDGDVTSLDREGESLPVSETDILIDTTVSATTANEIQTGDTVDVGTHTVATVTDVQLYPTETDEYRAFVGAELATIDRGSTPQFSRQAISVDRTIYLSPDNYDIEGDIVRRGATTEPGVSQTTTAEVTLEDVPPSVANGVEEGMTENIRDETIATVRSVDQQPSDVVTESDDGNIFLREHPKNKDVTLTADLQTRETETGLRFHGDSLKENRTVVLDFGTKEVEGTVTEIR